MKSVILSALLTVLAVNAQAQVAVRAPAPTAPVAGLSAEVAANIKTVTAILPSANRAAITAQFEAAAKENKAGVVSLLSSLAATLSTAQNNFEVKRVAAVMLSTASVDLKQDGVLSPIWASLAGRVSEMPTTIRDFMKAVQADAKVSNDVDASVQSRIAKSLGIAANDPEIEKKVREGIATACPIGT